MWGSDEYSVEEAEAREFGTHKHGQTLFDPTNNYKQTIPIAHAFIQKPQPNPGGAAVYALSNYGTPPFNPIGSAFYVRRMPYPCEPALQSINTTDITTGVGGLVTGQAISQPLYDESSDTYGGYNLA